MERWFCIWKLILNRKFRPSSPNAETLELRLQKMRIMWKRTIKYLLNFAGICLMIFYANVGYGIIARLPECENVKEVIWKVIEELCLVYVIYLIIITTINILFERKIEKRKSSKEFLFLAVFNIIMIVSITVLFSNQFYKMCCP